MAHDDHISACRLVRDEEEKQRKRCDDEKKNENEGNQSGSAFWDAYFLVEQSMERVNCRDDDPREE